MRKFVITLTASLAIAAALPAQEPERPIFEVRPFIGAYVPTGAQSDRFEEAVLVGGSAAFELRRYMHVVGTFAWALSKEMPAANGINLFQYDLGLEFNLTRALGVGSKVKPFAGFGAGGRTYDYRSYSANAQTYLAGYGALGTEFQFGEVAVRLEGRDYVSRFEGMLGFDRASTRNDLMFVTGISYHFPW